MHSSRRFFRTENDLFFFNTHVDNFIHVDIFSHADNIHGDFDYETMATAYWASLHPAFGLWAQGPMAETVH